MAFRRSRLNCAAKRTRLLIPGWGGVGWGGVSLCLQECVFLCVNLPVCVPSIVDARTVKLFPASVFFRKAIFVCVCRTCGNAYQRC